jgi:hypothetical protein
MEFETFHYNQNYCPQCQNTMAIEELIKAVKENTDAMQNLKDSLSRHQ